MSGAGKVAGSKVIEGEIVSSSNVRIIQSALLPLKPISPDILKITIMFSSNEIRADGLKVLVYNKNCKTIDQVTNCKTNTSEGEVANEIKNAILKKATILKKTKTEKQVKEFKKKRGVTE